jgi:hypothetical protein
LGGKSLQILAPLGVWNLLKTFTKGKEEVRAARYFDDSRKRRIRDENPKMVLNRIVR